MMLRLGIDIGGTWIKYASVSPKLGRAGERKQRNTPAQAAELTAVLREIVNESILLFGKPERIGVSVMGELDEKKGIILDASNVPGLNGYPMKETVQKISGVPAAVGNDARCALIAEMLLGAGTKADSCAMLTIGTGVGGAAATRRMLENNSYYAELGHLPLIRDGEACTCGKRGCMEAYASCTALERDYRRMGGSKACGAGEILKRVYMDRIAAESAQRYFAHLSAGIWMLAQEMAVEQVILGGGLTEWELFFPSLLYAEKKKWDQFIPVERAAFGNDAGLIGATLLDP